jgi:hypothetical protein
MTKTMIDGFGWVYVVVVLDWHTIMSIGIESRPRIGVRPWGRTDCAIRIDQACWSGPLRVDTDQAAVLTWGRVFCSSNWLGLR